MSREAALWGAVARLYLEDCPTPAALCDVLAAQGVALSIEEATRVWTAWGKAVEKVRMMAGKPPLSTFPHDSAHGAVESKTR